MTGRLSEPSTRSREKPTPLYGGNPEQSSALAQSLTFRNKPVELLALLSNPFGRKGFISRTRLRRSLLNQLTKIIAKDRDSIVQLLFRKIIWHFYFLSPCYSEQREAVRGAPARSDASHEQVYYPMGQSH